MLRGLGTAFLLAGAMIASSMRIGIPDDHRRRSQSLLGGLLPSWPASPPPPPPQQKFPNSWSSQQQGLRRQQSSVVDLQVDLLRQYFALQGLHGQSQILDHLFQQPPYRRVQRSRTTEQHRQEEEVHSSQGEEDEREEREKEEDEDEDRSSSEEEFNQHLSLFPELLFDSQAGPRGMLRQKKEGEGTNFIKKTLLPYPRLG